MIVVNIAVLVLKFEMKVDYPFKLGTVDNAYVGIGLK